MQLNYYINLGHVTLFPCVSISAAVKWVERSRWSCCYELWFELPLIILEAVSVPQIQWYTYECVSIGPYFYLPESGCKSHYYCVCDYHILWRLLVYINVQWDLSVFVLLLSVSVFLPELSCSSNVLAFSNSLVIKTGKMFIKIYTSLMILIIRETYLITCPFQKSSLIMNLKDSTLVLSRGTNDSVTKVMCWSAQAQDCGCPNNVLDAK